MSRRSETSSNPTETERASTWIVSMMGNVQMDSRMDVPMLVSCNHWHMLKIDIWLKTSPCSAWITTSYYDMPIERRCWERMRLRSDGGPGGLGGRAGRH